MAAGKRIRHAAWFPAVTFELRLFAKKHPTLDSRPKGSRQPSSRVCSLKVETVEAPQSSVRGASPASGTTVGVMGHG